MTTPNGVELPESGCTEAYPTVIDGDVPGVVIDMTAREEILNRVIDLSVGEKIVKLTGLLVPPLGAGLTTVIWTVPGAMISAEEIAACNCVGLTNVVLR